MSDGKKIQWLQTALLVCGCCAALYMLFIICRSAWFFLDERAFVRDASMYWAVGRGILNGLIPYTDVFEIKPPGVFLLSVLSFKMLGTPALGNILSAATLFVAPLIGAIAGWKFSDGGRGAHRMLALILLGILPGVIWSAFLAEKVGPWQTELFGSLFAACYAALLFFPSSFLRTAGLSIVLLSAVAFKEPVLFSCAGAAVLVARKPRDLVSMLIVPAVLAMIVGTILLFVLGWFDGYISVYLPSLLIRSIRGGPLWLRGFSFPIMARNLFHVSVLLPAAVLCSLSFLFFSVSRNAGRKRIFGIAQLLLALYLAMLAIGSPGDYLSQHFGFFTPFFVAMILTVQRALSHAWGDKRLRLFGFGLLALWLVSAFTLKPPADSWWPQDEIYTIRQAASSLDAILDRCGVERYLHVNPPLGDLPLFGWTRHSPINHFLYLQFDAAIEYGQYFLDESMKRLSEAQMIAFPTGTFSASNDIGVAMMSYISEAFTQTPPKCASSLPTVPGYVLLFRVDQTPFNPAINVKDMR